MATSNFNLFVYHFFPLWILYSSLLYLLTLDLSCLIHSPTLQCCDECCSIQCSEEEGDQEVADSCQTVCSCGHSMHSSCSRGCRLKQVKYCQYYYHHPVHYSMIQLVKYHHHDHVHLVVILTGPSPVGPWDLFFWKLSPECCWWRNLQEHLRKNCAMHMPILHMTRPFVWATPFFLQKKKNIYIYILVKS